MAALVDAPVCDFGQLAAEELIVAAEERARLHKGIQQLTEELDLVTWDLAAREEELIALERQLQQIRVDNALKLRVAKSRLVSSSCRLRSGSRRTSRAASPPLCGIEEGDEEQCEREDKAAGMDLVNTQNLPASCLTSAVNELAGLLVQEVAQVARQWQRLVISAAAVSPRSGSPSGRLGGCDTSVLSEDGDQSLLASPSPSEEDAKFSPGGDRPMLPFGSERMARSTSPPGPVTPGHSYGGSLQLRPAARALPRDRVLRLGRSGSPTMPKECARALRRAALMPKSCSTGSGAPVPPPAEDSGGAGGMEGDFPGMRPGASPASPIAASLHSTRIVVPGAASPCGGLGSPIPAHRMPSSPPLQGVPTLPGRWPSSPGPAAANSCTPAASPCGSAVAGRALSKTLLTQIGPHNLAGPGANAKPKAAYSPPPVSGAGANKFRPVLRTRAVNHSPVGVSVTAGSPQQTSAARS